MCERGRIVAHHENEVFQRKIDKKKCSLCAVQMDVKRFRVTKDMYTKRLYHLVRTTPSSNSFSRNVEQTIFSESKPIEFGPVSSG